MKLRVSPWFTSTVLVQTCKIRKKIHLCILKLHTPLVNLKVLLWNLFQNDMSVGASSGFISYFKIVSLLLPYCFQHGHIITETKFIALEQMTCLILIPFSAIIMPFVVKPYWPQNAHFFHQGYFGKHCLGGRPTGN